MMVDYPQMIPRLQTAKLRLALSAMRVVVLTGARQTGKTTLVKELDREQRRMFYTLDKPETLALAESDPEALWDGLELITIDEVQKLPDLLSHIKIEVDQHPRRGRFLLTGSANILLMKAVADSLAGRAAYIPLPPLSLAERLQRPGGKLLQALLEAESTASALNLENELSPVADIPITKAVFDGGYPETIQLPDEESLNLWREGYIATYLERDLRNLAQIQNLPDFIRLLRLGALRTGQLLNIDSLGRDAGLSSSTARRYLNLLEVSCQVARIPAYASNRSKRLIKAPKLFCTDSGLACYLSGITTAAALAGSAQLGGLLETYVLQNLVAFTGLLPGSPEILYWRTARGEEVDFVVETTNRLLPIEVKSTRALRARDLRGLQAFLNEYADLSPIGVVLYAGQEWLRPARNIVALPWSTMLAN